MTQGISTAFMFAIPLSRSYVSTGVAFAARSFLMNMATPLEQSLIMGVVVEDERGAAPGVSSALWSLPNALSSIVGAYLMALGFLAAPFFLAGLLYIASIALFWYFSEKPNCLKTKPKPKPAKSILIRETQIALGYKQQ